MHLICIQHDCSIFLQWCCVLNSLLIISKWHSQLSSTIQVCDRCLHSSEQRKAVRLDGGGSACANRSSSLMQQGRNRQWQPETRKLYTRLKAHRVFFSIRFIEHCKSFFFSFFFCILLTCNMWYLSLLIKNICGTQPVNRNGYICIGCCVQIRAIPCVTDYVSAVDTETCLFFRQCGLPLHGKCQIAVVFEFMQQLSNVEEEVECECNAVDTHI